MEIFVCFLIVTIFHSILAGKYDTCFKTTEDYFLNGLATKVVSSQTLQQCQRACLIAPMNYNFTCRSACFYPKEKQENCILNTESSTTVPSRFVPAAKNLKSVHCDNLCAPIRSQYPNKTNVAIATVNAVPLQQAKIGYVTVAQELDSKTPMVSFLLAPSSASPNGYTLQMTDSPNCTVWQFSPLTVSVGTKETNELFNLSADENGDLFSVPVTKKQLQLMGENPVLGRAILIKKNNPEAAVVGCGILEQQLPWTNAAARFSHALGACVLLCLVLARYTWL